MTRHEASFTDVTGGLATAAGATSSISKTGGMVGGYAGYNWQQRNFVYGIEGDISWLDAKAQQTWGSLISTIITWQQTQDITWLATFRGRAGVDIDSTLLYLTGGLAVGGVKESYNEFCGNVGCFGVGAGATFAGFTNNTTKVGWTMGAGFEHMFDPHWTVRGEFRYVDLGRSTVSCANVGIVCGAAGSALSGVFSNTLMTRTVGVGYKF